jgi:hypothetical protein
MSEYVPYEERVRNAEEQEQRAAREHRAAHQARIADVSDLLAKLPREGTNCYLEILVPARKPRWLNIGKTIITKGGIAGGPFFVISEVLPVYRIPNGLFRPWRADPGGMTFDAFVAPDGRVWGFKGEGDSANTYQLLKSSYQRIADLTMDNLDRVADGLKKFG